MYFVSWFITASGHIIRDEARGPSLMALSLTLYVANRGVTMKLRFGGEAVPT
jgi:hypothetical protein